MNKKIDHRAGASLVELVLAMTVFSIVVFSLSTTLFYGLESVSLSGDRIRATLLAEEALEAIRNIRDNDFSTLADGTYGLDDSGGEWVLSGSSDTIDGFERELELLQINSNTFEVRSRVGWTQNIQRNAEVELYTVLTNWMLEALMGDWTTPLLESGLDFIGGGNGWKIQVSGNYAYIVRQSGSSDFVIVNVSSTTAPLIVSNTSVSGSLRDIRISGNYAYIASTSNSEEIIVYDISNPLLPIEVDTLNLSGNNNAQSLDLVGNILYVARQGGGQQVVTIDISNPLNIVELDSFNVAGSSRDIEVLGDYAYVSGNDNSEELEILNISDPNNIFSVDDYDYSGNADIDALEVFDDIVIAGRSDGEIWIADFSDFNSPFLVSTIDLDDDINDMDLSSDNSLLFVGSDENDNEMVIVDISDTSNPFVLGIFNASSDVNGVFYDESTDRFYGVAEDNSQELIILEPS